MRTTLEFAHPGPRRPRVVAFACVAAVRRVAPARRAWSRARTTCGCAIRSRSRPARTSRSSSSSPTAVRIAASSSRMLQAWLKTKPADVTFRRVPVMFQPQAGKTSRRSTTRSKRWARTPSSSPEVFVAIHGKGMPLWNEKDFLDWAASKGLDRKKVEDLFKSFGDRRQGEPREAARAGLRHPVGADDHRRRQVHRPVRSGCRAGTPRMPGAIDALVAEGARRTSEVVAPFRAVRVFLTGASSGLGEALARHYAAQRRDARPLRAARGRARAARGGARARDGRDLRRRRARRRRARRAPAPISSARFGAARRRHRQRRHLARRADRRAGGPAGVPRGVRHQRARASCTRSRRSCAAMRDARARHAGRRRERRGLSRHAGLGRVLRHRRPRSIAYLESAARRAAWDPACRS